MKMEMTFTNNETAQLIREQLHSNYNFSKGMGYKGSAYAYLTDITFSVVVEGVTYENVEIIATAKI